MSPRISRRRSLALPFVVTIAGAATGCVVHSEPAPARANAAPAPTRHASTEPAPAAPAGRAEPASAPGVVTNPPAPRPTVNPPAPKPAVVTNPPAPRASKDKPAPSATKAKPNEAKKKPVVVANPPRLPEAPKDGTVVTRKDGTCWWMAEVECPPKATCNPPPPKQVRCKSDGDDEPTR